MYFVGPGGSFFDSFDQQVSFFLDTYCLGWRDYMNPRCHLIPPTFEYEWAEISDEDVKNLQACNYKGRFLSRDRGQGSEHIVHRAIQKAANDGIAAPFLAIRNLTVNDRSKNALEFIFPNINWQALETDFLLIGPEIGLIAIEVKGGRFDEKKDFSTTKVHLPAEYKKGLRQLEKIETLTAMFAESLKAPPLPIRKIILTPNLERKRFENWCQNLPSEKRATLNQKLVNPPNENNKDNNLVQQYFKEDTEIGVTDTSPLLFQAIKHLLQASNSEIPLEVYETNAKFLAGLSSMIVKNGKDVSLQEKDFSAACSILMDNVRVGMQNAVSEDKQLPAKGSSHKGISKSGAMKAILEKLQIMYLTPEQLSDLRGDDRQMIIGAAGTGKTILLQAKAMQLMSLGEKVVVFAPDPLRWQYKTIFDKEGCTSYEIGYWKYFIQQFFVSSRLKTYKELFMLFRQCTSEILASSVFGEHPLKTNPLYDFLWKELPEGHLFFDEAAAEAARESYYYFLLPLLYAKSVREPVSTVWITWDPINISWNKNMVSFAEPYILSLQHLLGFSLTYMDKVMRSSEEVCKHFQTQFLRAKTILIPKPPLPGHKVQGIVPIIKEGHFLSEDAAFENLLTELPNILKSIACHDWPQNSIGISLHGALLKSENYVRLLSLFQTHLSENGIDLLHPLRLINNGQIIYPASMPELSQRNLYFQPFIRHEHKYTGSKAPAVIVESANIFSLEWPVVISLSINLRSEYQNFIDQRRYMNRSRAKITFIEFFYSYDIQTLVTCGCSLCQHFETKISMLNPTKNFLSSLLGRFFKYVWNGKLILTREQMRILQGAKRHIIIGGVSTGKTTVLQMKALELLEEGEKVMVCAPLLLRQQYKSLFDSRGLKNYTLFSCSAVMEGFRKTYGAATVNSWLWEIIGLTRSGQHCSSSNGFYSVLRKEFLNRHVFVDEVLEDFNFTGSLEKVHALITLAVGESGCDRYIWVACDQTRFISPSPWFNFYEKYFGFSLSYLNDIMNMSEGVHTALESSQPTYFFHRILRPSSSPIIFNLQFSYEQEALEHLLTKGLHMVLEHFVDHSSSGIVSHVGIVVVGNILRRRNILQEIEKISLDKLPNVKTAVVPSLGMDEQDRNTFMQKYWTPEMIQAHFSGVLSSDVILEKWPDIVVCSVEDALSLRWRRILILSVLPAAYPYSKNFGYNRYITRSRAIESFAELTYTFGSD